MGEIVHLVTPEVATDCLTLINSCNSCWQSLPH